MGLELNLVKAVEVSGFIDEKTRVPLSLVVSAIGFAALLVFAWASLSNQVAMGAKKDEDHDKALAQIAELKIAMAVVNAKADTTIELIGKLLKRERDR